MCRQVDTEFPLDHSWHNTCFNESIVKGTVFKVVTIVRFVCLKEMLYLAGFENASGSKNSLV